MKHLVLVVAAVAAFPLFAKIQLAAPFTEGAVLQRERPVPVWGRADAGKTVTVTFGGAKVETKADADGKWRVKLPAMAASKTGRTLVVTERAADGSVADEVSVGDVLVGEVWMCAGQSNAELPIWGDSPRFRDGQGATVIQMTDKPFVRLVKTPRGSSSKPMLGIPVKWLKMTPALMDLHRQGQVLPSAMGYYFALELANALDVPIGLVSSSFGGANIDAWTPRCGYKGIDELKDVAALPTLDGDAFNKARQNGVYKGKGVYNWAGQQPAAMWNAMAAAYAPMAIRGVIWYQGCQNVGEPERYCAKMHALYNGWAKEFDTPGLPFYFAQLAPWGDARAVYLQMAQAKFAAEEKNAEIAIINDVGNLSDIHPNDKRTVARRLVLHALRRDYGWKHIRNASPVFKSMEAKGDTVTLTFDNVEELYLYNPTHSDKSTGFELAGADGVFKPAEVKNFRMTPHWQTKKPMFYGHIEGKTIVLVAKDVPQPVKVRYLHASPWFGGIYNEVALPLGAFAAEVKVEPIRVRFGGRLVIPSFKTMLEPKAAGGDWCFNGGAGGFGTEKDGAYHFKMFPNLRPEIAATMRVSAPTTEVVRADYVFTPSADLTLRGGFVNLELSYADLKGGHLLVEGRRVDVPKGSNHFALPKNSCRRLSIVRAGGERMDVEIVSPEGTFWIQNNRPWGYESASVRFGFPREADGSFKGGKDYALSVVVKGAGSLDPHPAKRVVISAGPDWVPIKMRGGVLPGSALDFSKIRRTEAPAGKYGRIVAKGAHFEFERLPGVAQRFYGANVCMSANVPTKEASRRFAEDFARRGYNSVRLHHHERPLVDGMNDPAALTFNPKALDLFDALIAACVTNGLYLTTDLFVTRAPITYRALGIDKPGELPVMDFKFYVPVHPGTWSNFCAWTRMFLTHRNPYTGRTLAEEPALACLSLVNEGPLNAKDGGFYASVPEWKAAWLKWLGAKRAKDPQKWAKVRDEIPSNYGESIQGAAFLAFLADVERDFAERVRKLVHGELGCPVPLANMNNNDCMGMQGVRDAAYEYVDDHFYVDHPHFLGKPWSLPSECPNVNPVMNAKLGAHTTALERSFDKPFAVSEYNYCGPGRFRGCGGIVTAAEGALQDWSALWRFAWTHSHDMMGNTTRGSVGYFDAAGDPLALASDRASICLFLRGDLAPLKGEYPIRFPDGVQDAPNPLMAKPTAQNWTWATWYRRVGMTLRNRPGQISLADAYARSDAQVRADLGLPAEEGVWPVAGDGTVKVDPSDGTFNLSTPRTSGGFTGGREIRTASLDATLDGQAATVWASSLDDAPIAESRRLLVTHLPDVQNDGVTYADEDLRILLANGRSAPMMRACKASIALRCARGPWKVHALGTDGSRRREIAADYADGALRFVSDTAADRSDATFLYEVVREACSSPSDR